MLLHAASCRHTPARGLHSTVVPRAGFFSHLDGGITKVIHQSWKSHTLLPHHAEWHESWKSQHPGWLYKLWTDTDNLELIKESLPWFLDTYNSFPDMIYRVDAVRYAYMYVYGGVYADLDFEALKPLDGLLYNSSLTLAMESEDLNGDGNPRLANSILASSPGHPFWIHLLTSITKTFHARDAQHSASLHPIDVTGPDAVSRAYGEFSKVHGLPIDVVRTGVLVKGYAQQVEAETRPCIYQGEDRDATFNKSACIAENAGAYTVTYWTGSWGGR